MFDVIIIGCGIVGAAAAAELSRYQLRTAVLEKENDVAAGTTKANSAIIHAGYDPQPGTEMARLNVEGARMAQELCTALNVPYQRTGSLVLAFNQDQLAVIGRLCERGRANGVPGIEVLSGEEARRIEPGLAEGVTGALYAPGAAVVSPWEYALALAETAVVNGVELNLGCAVQAIEKTSAGWRVTAGGRDFETRFILNAAGVHAGRIHDMAAPHAFNILPSRGEYYLLDKSEGSRVSHVVFQCPTPEGKGVLVAPTVHGNLIVGPNAVETPDGEDVSTTPQGLANVMERARLSVPSINFRDTIRNFAGVRAQSDREDFIIGPAAGAPGFIDLAGIKSPGLSAAPAIAVRAAQLLREQGLELAAKKQFLLHPRPVRFKELPTGEKNALVRREPLYGRVICRCETVTEGEIVRALRSPIPPCSLDGVKRRVGAGMGRCQGGFCGPRVLEIIARETGRDPCGILQDKAGSVILSGETKTGGTGNV